MLLDLFFMLPDLDFGLRFLARPIAAGEGGFFGEGSAFLALEGMLTVYYRKEYSTRGHL